MVRRRNAVLVIVAVSLLPPGSAGAPAGEGADSPAAVAAALEGLGPARWGEALPVVHPDDRGAWAVRVLALARMGLEAADEGRSARAAGDLRKLLEKHALVELLASLESLQSESDMSEQALAKAMAEKLPGKELGAMVGDLGAFIDSVRGDGADPALLPGGKLEGVRIEGDVAYGSVAGVDLVFGRRDGRWYWRPLE